MDKSSDRWEPSDEEFKKIQNMSLEGAEDSFRYIYGDLFFETNKAVCVGSSMYINMHNAIVKVELDELEITAKECKYIKLSFFIKGKGDPVDTTCIHFRTIFGYNQSIVPQYAYWGWRNPGYVKKEGISTIRKQTSDYIDMWKQFVSDDTFVI